MPGPIPIAFVPKTRVSRFREPASLLGGSHSSSGSNPMRPKPCGDRLEFSSTEGLCSKPLIGSELLLSPGWPALGDKVDETNEANLSAVDLSWLSSIGPEVEAHLLPTQRAILGALREYRKEYLLMG